jgi:predicted deacetylase
MALLITIHDVTPALMPAVETLWRTCTARGVVPGLLVVPDWHGGAPFDRDPAFCEWVRARAAEGAELFLHGERHDEVGSPRGWRDEVRAFGRTNNEGEFLTLDYDAALARITRGVQRMRAQGMDPIGFVPPAWLCTPATHDAVHDVGLAVSEDDGSVYAHRSGARLASPVVRWSARGAFRSYASVAQERLRGALQAGAPVMRIALHPFDLAHPAVVRSIDTALDRWTSARPQTFYRALSTGVVS